MRCNETNTFDTLEAAQEFFDECNVKYNFETEWRCSVVKPCGRGFLPFCGVPETDNTTNFNHHDDGCYLKMAHANLVVAIANKYEAANLKAPYSDKSLEKAWNSCAERTCETEECE